MACFVLATLWLGCSGYINPEMYVDPTDPFNPYYVEPATYLLTAFGYGDTLEYAQVDLRWRGTVPDSCLYTWTVDSLLFADWSRDSLVLLPPLDEGWHLFEIRAKYFNGVEQTQNSAILFYIDAVPAQSLWLSPRYRELPASYPCSFDIWLEEVENWCGGRITVTWDHMQAAYSGFQLYDQSFDFILQNNSEVVSRVNTYPDSLVLDIGLVDELTYGIQGSGKLARVSLLPTGAADTLQVGFGASSDFRDPANQVIPIAAQIGAVVVYR